MTCSLTENVIPNPFQIYDVGEFQNKQTLTFWIGI